VAARKATLGAFLVMAFMAAAAHGAPPSTARDYALWRSTSSGWTWQPVSVPAPLAIVRRDGRAEVWSFVLRAAAVEGLKPDRLRVGVANAALGAPVPAWIAPGNPYRRDPRAAGPLGVALFGGAPLRAARVAVSAASIRADLTLDASPDLRSGWDLYLLLDVDGVADTGYLGADYLVQNVVLGGAPRGVLALSWFEARPGIVAPGGETTVALWVENTSARRLTRVRVGLALPDGLRLTGASPPARVDLAAGECRRFAYRIRAGRAGDYLLRAAARGVGESAGASAWLTAVGKRDPEHEFRTAAGWWARFPDRPTLQKGNNAPLRPLERRSSSELGANLFGVTAHIPRSVDSEDPFAVAHAADGDPATCWASRWWRVPIPYEEEWLRVDFGAAGLAAEVRLLPAWRNSGFPVGFTLETSTDGRTWGAVAKEHRYAVSTAPEGDPLRCGDASWQRFTFSARPVRYVRLRANHLAQGNTAFFCAPFDPFQLRVAEVAVLGADGRSIEHGRITCTSSSTHHAWFNDPASIARTWPLLAKSGVKLNRIGQWGDKTDWASVERERGVLSIDDELEREITRCVDSGVDVLMTLDYGNNLYQRVPDSPDFGPTWHLSHPFLQCAPTTDEAVRAFARYCGFMAERFRGRVRYYEIWNEENGWFFDAWANGPKVAMAEAYGRALLAGARAVKEADPSAKVVFGGTAGVSLDYPRIALDQGAGPLVDALAFHPYGHPTPEGVPTHFLTRVGDVFDWRPRPEGIRTYEEEIAAIRALAWQYSPKMEVWADEMNWFAPGEPAMPSMGDMSELTQAKYLARFFTLNAWLGCRAVWWSLYNANGIQEWAIVRSEDESPRPAHYAAANLSTALDRAEGAPDVRAEVAEGAPDDLYVKPFRAPGGKVLVAVWRTAPPRDDLAPVPVTLLLPDAPGASVEVIDSLYGVRQRAVCTSRDGRTEVRGLLVGDWPVIVAVAPAAA
jgi:hypothetical protein